MPHKDIRRKFLEFFEKNGHKIVPSSSFIPQDDSSVLLTTAGMQQFKPYYLEKESPYGNRAASIQKCFRTSDIEEVGDERHLTFFEMLGNFSFKYPSGEGSYFKEEAIRMAYEFAAKEMGLNIDYVTVFEGDKKAGIPKDEEAIKIWKEIGMTKEKIKFFGREDNFWGPTGEEGPCGPTTEIYVNGIEIWNVVFNEYYCDKEGKFTKLKYQGIDTGMGLERLAMVLQKTSTIFETDLFLPIIEKIKNQSQAFGTKINPKHSGQKSKSDESKTIRIIADHLRGAVFLMGDGLTFSNTGAGYILRRIIRRAARYAENGDILEIVKTIINEYGDFYSKLKVNEYKIVQEIKKEIENFKKTLEKGLEELNKLFPIGQVQEIKIGTKIKEFNRVDVEKAFFIYQTYGFPFEMIQEELAKRALLFSKEEFDEVFKKHQEISRAGAENKFGGHGANLTMSDVVRFKITKLHTATHLLQAALRKILGDEVKQMGSDINNERLRLDFSFGRKISDKEIKKVEDLINQKIKEDLKVLREEMNFSDAINSGALAFFKEKYPEKVSVYSVLEPGELVFFSREICGGPHAERTGVLGAFKVLKEESSSAGVRRIKATLK